MQFTKLPLNDPAQGDTFDLDTQETVEFTLYFMPADNRQEPVWQGRKLTEGSQALSPGCADGSCKHPIAVYDRFSFTRQCVNGETLIAEGWFCRTQIRGYCPRVGQCNFGPDRPGIFNVIGCSEHYRDPLPLIGLSNYVDVQQSGLNLSKIFSHATVRYSDSAFSIPGQASPIPWEMDQFFLGLGK